MNVLQICYISDGYYNVKRYKNESTKSDLEDWMVR